MKSKLLIGFTRRPTYGGPGTFQCRLIEALTKRGHRAVYPEEGVIPDLILVVGGTVKLARWLLRCKRQGAKIVHRLDGINWRHGLLRHSESLSGRIKTQLLNWMIVAIRNRLADCVVYQSEFARDLWHSLYRKAPVPEFLVYNGTDLDLFTSARRRPVKDERPVLACIEGEIYGDAVTLGILREVVGRLLKDGTVKETLVCGEILSKTTATRLADIPGLRLLGNLSRNQIAEIHAQANVYLSLEVNPACPNAVIEALASGLPVVGFDTGSLRELVPEEAGVLAPYEGNPWRLQVPPFVALEAAVRQALASAADYGRAAREVAERRFGLEQMTNSYLDIFLQVLNG